MRHPVSTQSSRAGRQRGAALLTAMIIVTLVVTLASSMVWQQWRAVQVEAAERARQQAEWILTGALGYAKFFLRENMRTSQGVDAPGQPWATPLAETRMSEFLGADSDHGGDDTPDAFLSGGIADAQARYNLTNLVNGGVIDPLELAVFGRLCENLALDASVAGRIAGGLQRATASQSAVAAPGTAASAPPADASTGAVASTPLPVIPPATGPAPLLPRSLSQLAWLGIDPKVIDTLRPYVVLLPLATPVNVNTTSREVLAAEIAGLDLGSADRLLKGGISKNLGDFAAKLPVKSPITAKLGVGSSFFEIRGRLRLADRVLEERWMVQRQQSGQVDVIESERLPAQALRSAP